MKRIAQLLLVLFFIIQAQAQEKSIETQSVLIDDLISFAVNNFEADDSSTRNLTFLIQTRTNDMSPETLLMLKQGFKLISERLSEDSQITIILYTYLNGLVLEPTGAKEIKLILNTLDDLKSNVIEPTENGIDLAYKYAETNYGEDSDNVVLMIRNNDFSTAKLANTTEPKKKKSGEKSVALLGIAIGVLPEIISAIKD